MKKNYILLIFIVGFVLNLVGAFFKIKHWENGNVLLVFGLLLQVIAAVIFLYQFYTSSKSKK